MVELVPHCFVLPLVGTRSVWTGIVPLDLTSMSVVALAFY